MTKVSSTFLIGLILSTLFTYSCSESSPNRPDFGISDGVFHDYQNVDYLTEKNTADISVEDPDRCGGGDSISLQNPSESFSGTTEGLGNEFGSAIRCGLDQGFEGPQRYYRIALDAASTYRFIFKPSYDHAVFFLFSTCSEDLINADCSTDDNGLFSGVLNAGEEKALLFKPLASGTYIFAIDGVGENDFGAYDLTIESYQAEAESSCQNAKAISFNGVEAKLSGVTYGAKNEFSDNINCLLSYTFNAGQLYYSVDLDHTKTYELSLAANYPAAAYLFSDAANCVETNINLDCSTQMGTVIPPIEANSTQATSFQPLSSGNYIVAVDGIVQEGSFGVGAFDMTIKEVQITDNQRCDLAETQTLVDGKLTIVGDTSSALNDLGAHMACGGKRLVGKQRYYQVHLEEKAYQFTFKPQFSGVVGMGVSCLTLPIDCASNGLSGHHLEGNATVAGSLIYQPKAAGDYILVVDSEETDQFGSFELTIETLDFAQNDQCAAPQTIVIGDAINADTGKLKNDLDQISCGGSSTLIGPQAYYRLDLKAGEKVALTLTPEAQFDPALYVFEASTTCESAAVEAACSIHLADQFGAGKVESLELNPTVDTSYIIVVDSYSPSEVGLFMLTIRSI